MSTRTHEAPSAAVADGDVTVAAGNGATLVIGADTTRRSVTIINSGTVLVRISGGKTTGGGAGFPLIPNAGYVWTSAAPCYAWVPGGADGLLSLLAETGDAL
ncbi:MAG: hypothetical protein JWO67_12 [Streptosporangiaceae bacterium]|nr:hypothetical protein [Streptosporangiaceae bacterium]